MKKITLLFILCGVFSMMSKAQLISLMMQEGAEWKIYSLQRYWEWGTSIYFDEEVILRNLGDYFTGDNGEDYSLMEEWADRQMALRVRGGEVRIVFKTENGFNFENEVLLYNFDAHEGDTIVHGPVFRDFPHITPAFFIEDASERFDDCFSVVRKVTYPDGVKQMLVDCFATYERFDTDEKDTIQLGSDLWVAGVGSIYGFYTSWAGMHPVLVGPGWTYSYYTMSFKIGINLYYNNPIYPDPDFPQDLSEIGTSDLNVDYDPSSRNLSVFAENQNPATFQLFDLSGRLVVQVDFFGDATIPLKDYAEGIYLCKIIRAKQVVYSSKLRL